MQKQKNKSKPQRFAEVQRLEERIIAQAPKPGQYFYDYKLQQATKEASLIDQNQFHSKFKINFADLPISQSTMKGLTNRSFKKMTEVQRCSIPHALAGRDLLVSSRTGSGKTLAYLVPLVEKLYRKKFIPLDGLGAVVIVPVRQLAMQVFQVLNSFTEKMQLSIGLIIGGKDVKYEQQRIGVMNILICTPGRFLQHLQQTYGFETGNLQMLVLDEADVMMEMGFRQSLNSILQNIPKVQTLMFSATMTRDIMNLASICTSEPEKILLQGVNIQKEQNEGVGTYETPAKLLQYYMIVSPQDKINTFYSFLKSHLKQKIVVFVSTCKQVRFLYECFRKFRLGTPLYELQGHQKQKKRMAIYFTFCEKRHGILLCTNIAARGLDFPLVDWVLQFDAPEQADTYVHRAGRTARYKSEGRCLLLVSEHELPLVDELKGKNIQIHKITQNPQRYLRVEATLRSICSQHQDVKYLAQRALISYLRFVFKAQNKKIFNLKKIDLQKFALSFGLPSAPNLNIKNQNNESESQEQNQDEQKQKLSKIQKLRLKQKMKKTAIKQAKIKAKSTENVEYQEPQNEQEAQESQQELLVVKGVVKNTGQKVPLTASKRQLKKIKSQGHFQGKNQLFFDDDGNALTADQFRVKQRLAQNKEDIEVNTMQLLEDRLQTNKQADEQVQRERRKVKRRKRQYTQEIKRRGGEERMEAVLDDEDENFQ